jgi:hypothetical protein
LQYPSGTVQFEGIGTEKGDSKLKVLHAGESLSVNATKNFDDKDAGTYEFWADYFPPRISTDDQAVLQKTGIDFPQ